MPEIAEMHDIAEVLDNAERHQTAEVPEPAEIVTISQCPDGTNNTQNVF